MKYLKQKKGLTLACIIMYLAVLLACPVDITKPTAPTTSEASVPVHIVLGGQGRTIAPEHITLEKLKNNYTLNLTATSPGGKIQQENSWNLDPLLLDPGVWKIGVVATEKTNTGNVLSGFSVINVDGPTWVPLSLKPIGTGTGSVEVQFTIPEFVVKHLDPVSNTNQEKQITISLYDKTGTTIQARTTQTLPVTPNVPVRYTANNTRLKAGQYMVMLSSNYTANNAATENVPIVHRMEWKDILYVESGRTTRPDKPIEIPKEILGVPGNPHRSDKVNTRWTVSGSNNKGGTSWHNVSGSSYSVNPYNEGLWIHGANWDGSSNNRAHNNSGTDGYFGGTFGNEVLFITWDGLYNVLFYELELLINNESYGVLDASAATQVDNISKFKKIPVGNDEWEKFKTDNQGKFLEMKFTGKKGDVNNYKTKVWTSAHLAMTEPHQDGTSYRRDSRYKRRFRFVADRDKAATTDNRRLFGQHYKPSTTSTNGSWISPADPVTGLSKFNHNFYRIGLEGGCNAIGILTHNMADGNWYGIRLRAINEYGTSDWVYWKGGKN